MICKYITQDLEKGKVNNLQSHGKSENTFIIYFMLENIIRIKILVVTSPRVELVSDSTVSD